jgi:hypothetical protein
MAIRDEDITTVMTQAMEGSPHDATLCLHVKLSYLFTSILSCKAPKVSDAEKKLTSIIKQFTKTRKQSWGHF